MMNQALQDYYLDTMGIKRWIGRSQLPSLNHANATQAWQQLQDEVNVCRACPLGHSRTQAVFGVGNKEADILIVGEAPGFHEDQQGEPFVGKAGQLLTKMLMCIGLTREQV